VVDYASAKGGIAAFTKNVAKELLPYNIQVNAVVPVAESRMTRISLYFTANSLERKWGQSFYLYHLQTI